MNEWRKNCLAVIPCLNEAAGIGSLVTAVQEYLPRVCVVDDGSSDGTGQAALAAGAHVIRNASTHGKGHALKQAWTYAREEGFSWVLALDGDGQHSAQDIPAFFRAAREAGADLVIGNRMIHARKRMPLIRRWVNVWMSYLISKRAGVTLPDTQCGFRLVKLEFVDISAVCVNHYEIESDLVLRLVSSGCKIVFVPVQVIYAAERSKINPIIDTFRWLGWWMKEGRTKSGKTVVSSRQSRNPKPE